jgi:FAD/FMN-containing dehydrogenase
MTGAAALRGDAQPLALLDLAVVAEPVAGGLRSARGVSRSISAEHGLGQSRAGIIGDHKDAYELQLMRGVKELFDPAGLMNPGRVVPNA